MVFFYFGPTASSWATGNDLFSTCRELPPTIEALWNSIGEFFPDKSLTGTRIDWISTGVDGSYCVMLRDGNVLSNRSDLLQSIGECRQAQMYVVVDHVSFSPYGAYLIRLSTGSVMLSPETAGRFPDTFMGLASDFLHFSSPYRYAPQYTQLQYVFFGPNDSVLVKAYGGALRWQGLPESLITELRALTVGVDMLSAGFQLGKRTTLCPWDANLYFLEFESFLGNTAMAYPYSLRLNGLSAEAMQYIVVNQRPPEHLISNAQVALATLPTPPPPPLAPAPAPVVPVAPPTPPASVPPESRPELPPRTRAQPPPAYPSPAPAEVPIAWSPPPPSSLSLPPPPPLQQLPTPQPTPATPAPAPAPAAAPAPVPQFSSKSEDEERMDAFVHSLAMPSDIRAMAEQLWLDNTARYGNPSYLTGSQAMLLFAASGLGQEDLAMIWDKTDLDRNGLLDREEFIQAVYLIAVQQHLRGISDSYDLATRAEAAGELNASLLKGGGDDALARASGGGPAAAGAVGTRDAYGYDPTKLSLRGSVKEVFRLFLEAGKEVKTAYNTAYQQNLQQQQQQMQAINAAYTSQAANAYAAQLAESNNAMQAMHAASVADAEAALAALSMASEGHSVGSDNYYFGGGSGGGGGGGARKDNSNNTDEKDTKAAMSKQLRESLMGSIVTEKPNVHWDDVAGLGPAKDELQEAVVFPLKFPHMFQGRRKPRRAILLYGPPGTGKSYLAKAVATEVDYTLFSISATDLTSKWFGESEGLVRGLFDLAREKKPSVIFIDEIDALCNNRESGGGGGGGGDGEGTTARLKTEFLVQMDGVGRGSNDGVVILAATNLPWSLDPAIRRRFQKRIHIPLPDAPARMQLFRVHGGDEFTRAAGGAATPTQQKALDELARRTDGFSGSDVANAVQDALMLPVKRVRGATHFRLGPDQFWTPCAPQDPGARAMTWKDVPGGRAREPPLTLADFFAAVAKVKPSVGANEIQRCLEWTEQFGLEGA